MIYYNKKQIWTFQDGQVTAPNIVVAKKPDNCLVVMDFTQPMNSDDSIDSITSAAFADVALLTEPTITSAISSDQKKVELTLNTASASRGTYTISIKVVTEGDETLVRKGRLVVE